MGNLESAIDELAGEDLSVLTGLERAERLLRIDRVINRLEAERCRSLAHFDRSGRWADDGALSAKAWLRHHCRMAPGAAAEHARVARRLPELPATEAAFTDGEISYAHVRVITRATGDLQPQVVDELETVLTDAGRELDPKRLRTTAEHARHALAPEKFLDAEQDAYQSRRLDISETFEGRHVIDGEFHPEAGAVIATAVHAAETMSKGDPRTPRQRRADAMEIICRSYLDRGEAPRNGGERPHLNLELRLETLEGRAGSEAATLAWSDQPISGEAARRIACDAGISRIITNGRSEPLDVGRRTRVVPAALRRAVIARDKHCTAPGCDHPWEWCDTHHDIHWIDGDPTALWNLRLLCHVHHPDEHEGRDRDRSPPSSTPVSP
jgi:Domain of unknown function (DUF222)